MNGLAWLTGWVFVFAVEYVVCGCFIFIHLRLLRVSMQGNVCIARVEGKEVCLSPVSFEL